MSSPRALNPKGVAAAFAVSLLIALTLPFRATAAEAPQVRTDPGDLPGYTVESQASPLSMLMYEPVIPVPVDPGEPHGEGSLSYTSSKLETGPQGRAVASSIWPGPAIGDGFSTICECEEQWRVKSESTYPGKNTTNAQEAGPTGAGMRTSALGLDVFSRASSSQSPQEDAMGFGNVHSFSNSTVRQNKAIANVVSSAEDVSIGGGIIQFKSVKTVLQATSDGKRGGTTGATEVNGLVIGGQGYVVDSQGIRPVEDGSAGDSAAPLPEMPGAEQMRNQLGIEVEVAKHEAEIVGADATRSAGGMRISITTSVLKNALEDNAPIDDIFGQLPDELRANLAALRALAPQVDYIFARGTVHAVGAQELDFGFGGPLPPIPPPAPPATGGSTGIAPPPDLGSPAIPGTPGTSGVPAPGIAPAPGAGGPVVPSAQPVAAPAALTPAAAEVPDFFGGLPPGLVIGALGLAALGGRGLAGLTGAAMSGVSGALCDRGALRKIPDLRAQA